MRLGAAIGKIGAKQYLRGAHDVAQSRHVGGVGGLRHVVVEALELGQHAARQLVGHRIALLCFLHYHWRQRAHAASRNADLAGFPGTVLKFPVA